MPGAGSISPPFQAPFITIKGLGGTVDQTAQVQAALDKVAALSTGYSYATAQPNPIPEIVIHGLCGISSGLTYAAPSASLHLRGAHPMSGFRCMAAGTYDVLTLGDGTAANEPQWIHVSSLFITSNGQKTGGAGIKVYTAALVHIDKCTIYYQYDGIRTERGSQQNTFRDNHVYLCSRYSIFNGVTGRNTATQGYGTEQLFLDNYIYSGDPASLGSSCIGIFHQDGDAAHYRGNHVVACGIGMLMQPSSAPNPEVGHNEINNNIISDSSVDCLVLDGTNQVLSKLVVSDNHLVYCLTAGVGLRMIGTNLRYINVRGNMIYGNTSGGIYLGSGPRDVLIDGNGIIKNGVAGIELQSGAQDFRIVNNRASNTASSGVGVTQPYGIKYGGSHDNCIITGNDLRGNGTAPTTGTAPTAGSTVVLTGNI